MLIIICVKIIILFFICGYLLAINLERNDLQNINMYSSWSIFITYDSYLN